MTDERKTAENVFFRQSFIRLWGVSTVVFLLFTVHLVWGNHDWSWIKDGTPLWSGVFEGRFSQFLVQTGVFGGHILPVLTAVTALGFLSAAAVMLFFLWEMPRSSFIYVLLGLNLVCAPYTISWFYFAFILLSNLSWVFFVVLGFYILHHPGAAEQYKMLRQGGAAFLWFMALGGYPPVVNLIGVLFFSLVLNDLCFKKLTPKSIYRKYLPTVVAAAAAAGLFLLVQYELGKTGLMYATYNTAVVGSDEFFLKLMSVLKAAFEQFFSVTGFVSELYKALGFCLLLSGGIVLAGGTACRLSSRVMFVLALSGLIFSSIITLFAAQNAAYVKFAPRIDFFGLLYIYLYMAAVLLKFREKVVKNLVFFILMLMLFSNICTAAEAGKVWRLGFRAEGALMERVLARLEESPQFDFMRKYVFVQGGALDFRSRYLTEEPKAKDSYTQTAPYIPWHLPSKAYKFYYPVDFFGADFDVYWSFVDAKAFRMTPALEAYFKEETAVWPAKEAIYLDDKTIVLSLTPDGRQRGRQWFYQYW